MNIRALIITIIGLAPTIACSQMVGTNDRVRVEVRVQSDTDHKDLKGTSADTITQNKTLSIRLTGKGTSPEQRTVKWAIYGRRSDGNDLVLLESAEFKLALSPQGEQVVETRNVSTSYTPAHSVSTGSGRGRRLPRAKRVAAEGTKYAGYVVRVYNGSSVVGEAFENPSLALQKP